MTHPTPETGPRAIATARRTLGGHPARLARASAYIEHLDGARAHPAPDHFLAPYANEALDVSIGGFVDPADPSAAALYDADGAPVQWPADAPVPAPGAVATPFGAALVVAAGRARLVLARDGAFDEGERALATLIARLTAPIIDRAGDAGARGRGIAVERRLHPLRIRGDLPGDLVAESPRFRAVLARVARLAERGLPVVLVGPTGVGKEVLTRVHHRLGPRRTGPLVAVNCAALPTALAEAHVFGHARGAYTGAVGDGPGYLESSAGGVLFLDELGELPLALQAKLLRALDGWTRRVGETGPERALDLRVTAATNGDLTDAARFRPDLLHRLGPLVAVPPLAERPADVLALARRTLRAESRRHGFAADTLAPDAAHRLTTLPLPGNARELCRLVRQTVALELDPDDPALTAAHLGDALGPTDDEPPPDDLDLSTRLALYEARLVAAALARHPTTAAAARALGDRDQTFRKRINRLTRQGLLDDDGSSIHRSAPDTDRWPAPPSSAVR